ncbi:hypothetical protein L2E82_12359 [Cichorium intybus]|uniref:Uncharacterized protein n=1 Tax=Cichorium intybus TaxID=13427 RepID=A0ACB9GFQ7_CICIN|nr:hypothetical protein L2E82_12359 [Cichorium intybus]
MQRNTYGKKMNFLHLDPIHAKSNTCICGMKANRHNPIDVKSSVAGTGDVKSSILSDRIGIDFLVFEIS